MNTLPPLLSLNASPLPVQSSSLLKGMIHHSLDHHLFPNAIFYAERLHAYDRTNEEYVFLLATCYFRAGQVCAAHFVLQNARSAACRYLFARCCLELEKFQEGEEVLAQLLVGLDVAENASGSTALEGMRESERTRCKIPDEASVYCLLGMLCQKSNRTQQAIRYFRSALSLNPMLWQAYDALCQLGAPANPDDHLKPLLEEYSLKNGNEMVKRKSNTNPQKPQPSDNSSSMGVRRSTRLSESQKVSQPSGIPISNREKKRTRITGRVNPTAQTNVLRSVQISEAKQQDSSSDVTATHLRKKILDPAPTESQPSSQEKAVVYQLIDTIRILAIGRCQLARYQCKQAIETFSSVVPAQLNTGWVMCQIGKAYFEMVDYQAAERNFDRARELEPHRLADMEIYSTLLWHLRKDVALSYLAHELVEFDRLSPQAWCAVGNCFSLKKEHDMAVKCFRRAIQIDPQFAYAHTLSGHEYMSIEDYDRAQTSFRSAIRADNRHYNAWFGLGMVYSKLGKCEQSDYHFRRAVEINPANAVLVSCIGMVQEQKNYLSDALSTYNAASRINSESAIVLFKKAKVLIKMRRYSEALRELETLKDLAPEEANVYFLLGKLYKQLGERTKALSHFTWALDLNPKMSHLVRDAIEKLHDEEEEADDDEDDDQGGRSAGQDVYRNYDMME
ncbi:uncharacterized protein VTP21DRAFT_936 [Calcarisporiella thermophila]|uniref:uncharacterized protein n=1 Tax=Calcarisporiella thermophila TaxID=911321 RepID=UPI003742336A